MAGEMVGAGWVGRFGFVLAPSFGRHVSVRVCVCLGEAFRVAHGVCVPFLLLLLCLCFSTAPAVAAAVAAVRVWGC